MNAISAANLCKRYERSGAPFHAVEDASLRVDRGEVVGIVGRSGSGKTTFLNMIAGLLSPSSGDIVVDGVDILSLTDTQMSLLRNRSIGYVPQGQILLSNLTVFDNIRLPYYLARRDENVAGRTAFLLDELGIGHLSDSYPANLSGGEMRRVAIARAMMNKPAILLADEPTGDLDAENIRLVMDIFVTLADRGVAVLFSTHEEDAVERAHRVVEMSSGRLSERVSMEAGSARE